MRRRFTQDCYQKRDDKPGDVMLINGAGKVAIVSPENILRKINRGYTPYGVVVVPSSHDVYGDGTMGIMSLKNTGYIPFGPYGHDAIFDHLPFNEWGPGYLGGAVNSKFAILEDVGPFPKDANIFCPLPISKKTAQSVMVPSDFFTDGNASCNPELKYNNVVIGVWDYSLAHNIYNIDGSMNPLCRTSDGNWFLYDYKGFENTKHIYDSYGSEWSNQYDDSYAYHELVNVAQGQYPIIEKAVNFDVKGRWYLPALGEFQYIIAKYTKIKETLSLIAQYAECEPILDAYFDSTIVNTHFHKQNETDADDRDRCSGVWFEQAGNPSVPMDNRLCSFGDDKNRTLRGRFMCRFSYELGFKSMSLLPVNKIIINQTIDDPFSRVSGAVNGDIIRYIRNNSHRVLAKKTAEGAVVYCRLDDSNSNLYHDGSASVLTGAEGDVFVKLPKFYYKATEGDIVNIFFATEKLDDDYIEWNENTLIGVYEGYIEDNKAYSRSSVASTGSVSHTDWKQYASNRGQGYQLVDWQMHCVMGCLYYAMYGNTNCQKAIGSGTNTYTKNTGQTDALGMQDTKKSINGNTQSINFWGLENWWGNKYEWIDDYVNPANTLTGTVNDPANGGTRDLDIPPSGCMNSFVKKMKFGRYLDLIAMEDDPGDGTNSTGYADIQWWPNSTSSSARMIRRSYNHSDPNGGVAYAAAYYVSSGTNVSAGSRLAFRGISTEISDVELFKSIPVV